MKTITREKEIIREQVEVKEGTFYFNIDDVSHKVVISFDEEVIDYSMEILTYFHDDFGIRIKKDYVFSGEELPYKIKMFITEDEAVKIITEEYYNTVRNEVKKRLWTELLT